MGSALSMRSLDTGCWTAEAGIKTNGLTKLTIRRSRSFRLRSPSIDGVRWRAEKRALRKKIHLSDGGCLCGEITISLSFVKR